MNTATDALARLRRARHGHGIVRSCTPAVRSHRHGILVWQAAGPLPTERLQHARSLSGTISVAGRRHRL
ncbi:hypothetical protein CITRIK5_80073 [Citricoccus sp. K5]|uniref:Uncharacterized protein n=1 Tax=Citricoccus parietis TaxID=592307 RepID=A0ABV5G8U7_9MICC|nr:hypothetical protein CITRIK5_80073 [Citricoccus sp. K5]